MTQQQPNPYAPQSPAGPPTRRNPATSAATTVPGQGTPAAAANPISGPGQPGLGDVSRNNEIYNVANPQMALRSALADMGYSPMSRNPVMKTLMSMAPGLASSFLMKGANGQIGAAGTEDMMNGSGGMGAYFGDFLRNAIGNNGAGAIAALKDPLSGGNEDGHQGAYGAMMTTERRLKQYEDSFINGGGQTPANMNPFAAYLVNMMSQDPAAGASMASSMYTPFMGAFARPYAEGVDLLNETGRRTMSRDIDRPEVNPFSWLLNPGVR